MSSTIKVNNIQNLAGDDSGIDLSTNDQIILKTANTTAITVNSSQNTSLAGDLSVTGAISGTDMQLLHTTTVSSNVGEVQIDGHFTSAFKNYKIIGSNVHTDTDNVSINMKFMRSGSVVTGSVHRSNRIRTISTLSTVANQDEASDTEFAKVGGMVGSASGEHSDFEILLFDPLATNNFKSFLSSSNSITYVGSCEIGIMAGFFNSGETALSGIEIDPSSGNIASGIFKLYGLR